jgi:PilZ domain-containing protein
MVVNMEAWDFPKARPLEHLQYHAQGKSTTNQDAKSRRSTSADAAPQNQLRGPRASPGQSPVSAQFSHSLNGRREKRLPIIMVVRLSRVRYLPTNEDERTYTDNVSAHGARVYSRCIWQHGEQAQVTPWEEESPMRGEVVYCQRIDNDRFCVGLKFQERPVTWSALRRYTGR